MIFNEWFGELDDAQWRAYRRHNISPSDHGSWTDTGWDGDTIRAWVNTLASVDCAPTRIDGPAWAETWERAGYTAASTLQVVASIVETTGRRSFILGPTDVRLAVVERQPSLFEQDPAPSVGPLLDRGDVR